MASHLNRPAFYALERGGWRDYVTLLHLPYTAWHLSYVVIGAGLAATFSVNRLLATLAAFLLAVGVGAHALDELNGRPLETRIPRRVLWLLAATSIAGAVAIGIGASILISPWLACFVVVGAFLVLAYNLELLDGAFHSDVWFALAWGALPVLCASFTMDERLRLPAVLGAIFAFALSLTQRRLSTQVRDIRRRVVSVEGTATRSDGHVEPITRDELARPGERALKTLTLAVILLAGSLAAASLS